jgi:hypothetical protein
MAIGNVALAAPTAVMPFSLSKAFSRSITFQIIDIGYKNGESQRGQIIDGERNTWQMTKRLAPAKMAELRTFYNALQGQLYPFYFYDPYDSNFVYDATGVLTTGRYIVRFSSGWNQTMGLGRGECTLSLIQID